tara:strand:- start:343 stop:513 length:171 start_codon:yes stop_codon:yes gene_type:complete
MSETKTENKTEQNVNEFTADEIRLIQWEEWALSMEEHFHAAEMFERNPNGLPMGHR